MKGVALFGDYIKSLRKKEELTLRQFCLKANEDPSNWSKIERGKLSPPQEKNRLEAIAKVLGIGVKSAEFKEMSDLANITAGKIPAHIMGDEDIVRALPAFLRTVGSVKPTPEEIEELIDRIRKGI